MASILVVAGGFCLVGALLLLQLVITSRNAGLSHIPGPFLARYTDLWRFYHSWRVINEGQDFSGLLTREYGDVIRIGPNTVAVFDPAAIPTIYGTANRLEKGEGYLAFVVSLPTTSLLACLDEERHSKYKRPVSHAYSLSAQRAYEPNIDRVINQLAKVLTQIADSNETANITTWCHYYAFDVVSELTFGEPLGLLQTGKDLYGMVKLQKSFSYYAATMSQLPWLDRIFKRVAKLRGTGSGGFVDFVIGKVQKRLQSMPKYKSEESKPDLLAHFVSAQERYPDVMTPRNITSMCAGNLFAGSQSPSAVFDKIFNFLTSNPSAQETLHAELSKAQCKYPVSWQQAQSLPYLDGLIREGYRLHNPSLFVLERMTPGVGLTLPSGHRIPAGTKIGMPSGAPGFRESVYGSDVAEFKPERWLQRPGESEDAYSNRRKGMEQSDFTFGYGSRTCIGRNIANMEIYKVVATMVGLFEFELVGIPSFFQVNVKLHKRQAGLANSSRKG
jgi:cytochrome P450